ncbi:MAG: hypothetical protein AB8B85_10300 [Paracoccaceae bacterium]
MRQLMNTMVRGLRDLLPQLGPGDPIRTQEALAKFLGERSAYVSQTSLYGYLKTRMGTQYATIFQDPMFQPALTKAREEAFFGCLGDLTIHAVATLRANGGLDGPGSEGMARAMFLSAAQHALHEAGTDPAPAAQEFSARLEGLDWIEARDPRVTFQSSQAVLVAAAPVIDSYREADREIIENSVKFRWIDIRRQLSERLDAGAVVASVSALA